jgi:hypothetical protein
MRPPPETGRPHDKQWLENCCQLVSQHVPENYCFAVFAFPVTGTDRVYYASNAKRGDVLAAVKEWIAHMERTGGGHHE